MSPDDVPAEWVEAAARAMADDWNPDRDPILTAMFRDYAASALVAVLPPAQSEAWDRGYAASDYEAYHLGTHGRTDNPYREGSAS